MFCVLYRKCQNSPNILIFPSRSDFLTIYLWFKNISATKLSIWRFFRRIPHLLECASAKNNVNTFRSPLVSFDFTNNIFLNLQFHYFSRYSIRRLWEDYCVSSIVMSGSYNQCCLVLIECLRIPDCFKAKKWRNKCFVEQSQRQNKK